MSQVDARQALADIQAGQELKDYFAGMSAQDVEQQIVQMLAAEPSHTEVEESEPLKTTPTVRPMVMQLRSAYICDP